MGIYIIVREQVLGQGALLTAALLQRTTASDPEVSACWFWEVLGVEHPPASLLSVQNPGEASPRHLGRATGLTWGSQLCQLEKEDVC